MAKKKTNQNKPVSTEPKVDTKVGNSLKDLLNEDMLSKLKGMDKELKQAKEKEAQEEADRRRREKEEKEKNKSFADLLEEYDKKSGGKYS